MKRVWVSLVAVGLLIVAALAPATAQDIVSIELQEVDDSGMTGGASLSSANGATNVSIMVTAGFEEDAVHPVHIHEGTCDDLGDVAYPLEDIVDGASESTVEASMADLMTGEYAINAHLSEDEMDVHVLCGNIPEAEIAVADDAVEDDDEVAEEDDDDMVEVDDEAVEEDADTEEVVPAAGSTGGIGTEAVVLMMTLMAGAAVGSGLLVRRRAYQS